MAEVDALVVKFEADLTNLKRELKKAETVSRGASRKMSRSMDKFSKSVRAAGARVGKMSGKLKLVATVGAAAMVVMGKKALDAADSLEDFANITGVSIGKLQELRFAADFVGTSANTLDRSLIRLNDSLGEFASKGTGEAADAFKRLGFSQAEVARISVDTGAALEEILVRVNKLGSEAQKTTILADIFGLRIGPRLGLLAREGADGIEVLTRRARESGAVMSTELVLAASKLKDEFTALNRATTTAFQAGLLGEFVDEIGSMEEATKDAAKAYETLGAAVGAVLLLMNDLIAGFAAMPDLVERLQRGARDALADMPGEFGESEKAARAMGERINWLRDQVKRLKGEVANPGVIAKGLAFLGIPDPVEAQLRSFQSELDGLIVKLNATRRAAQGITATGQGAPTPPPAPRSKPRRRAATAEAGAVDPKKQEKALIALDNSIAAIQTETTALGMSSDARALYNERLRITAALQKAGVPLGSALATSYLEQAEAAVRARAAQQTLNEQIAEAKSIIEATRTPQEAYIDRTIELNDLLAAGALSFDQYARAVEGAKKELGEAVEATKEANTAFDALGDVVSRRFEDFVAGATSFRQVIDGLAADLLKLAVKETIGDPIRNFLKSGDTSDLNKFTGASGALFEKLGFQGGKKGAEEDDLGFVQDPITSFSDDLSNLFDGSIGDLDGIFGDLTGGLSGTFDGFLDGFTSVLDSIISSLSSSGGGGGGGIGGIGGALQGLFGLGTGGQTGAQAAFAADFGAGFAAFGKGGKVGRSGGPTRAAPFSAFANAPRFGGGGTVGQAPTLNKDEVPAILHRGETVMTPAQMRKMNKSGSPPLIVNVNVETPNADTFLNSEGQIRAAAGRIVQIAGRRDL